MKKILIIGLILILFSGMVQADFTLKWSSTENTIQPYDSPVTADTNGDGEQDTLYVAGLKIGTDDWGIILALDGATGNEIWRREYNDQGASNQLNPIELFDVTGDGVPEVFTHFGANTGGHQVGFICLDGLTGETVWENRDYRVRPAWHHFIILQDPDTEIPYIFYNAHPRDSSGQFYMQKLDARNGNIIEDLVSGGTCNGGVSAADLEGDGSVEIIIGTHSDPGFEVYDFDLNVKWKTHGTDADSSTQSTMLLDVTGPTSGVPDGILDLISLKQTVDGGTSAGVNVIDGSTHQEDSVMTVDNLGMNTAAHGQSSVWDLNDDGKYEMTTGFGSPSVVFTLDSPPVLYHNLPSGWYASGAPKFLDLIGDSLPEIVQVDIIDADTFQDTGQWVNQWNGMVNDIDEDGLAELFGSRNGQITCYDLDRPPTPGINTHTAYFGYRRLASEIAYDPCPGSWFDINNNQPQPDITCWACSNGATISTTFPSGTTCGVGDAVNYPYSSEPDCSQPDEVCWKCENGKLISQTFSNGTICEDVGWNSTPPNCGNPVPGFEIVLLITGILFLAYWRKRK